MFGKWALISFAIFATLACARPKSAPAENPAPDAGAFGSADILFNASGRGLYWKWEKEPTQTATGSFLFRIFESSAVDGFPEAVNASVMPFVLLWMPDMGHGSSPVEVTQLTDTNGLPVTGAYRAAGVFFIMPGRWQMKIQIKNGNNVQDEAVISLTR